MRTIKRILIDTDVKGYKRDKHSKALLASDRGEADDYKLRNKILTESRSRGAEVEGLRNEVNNLKEEIRELKELILLKVNNS